MKGMHFSQLKNALLLNLINESSLVLNTGFKVDVFCPGSNP